MLQDAGYSIEDYVDYGEGEGVDGPSSKVIGKIEGVGFSITVYESAEVRQKADEDQLESVATEPNMVSLIAACGPISFVSGAANPTPEEAETVRDLVAAVQDLLAERFAPC